PGSEKLDKAIAVEVQFIQNEWLRWGFPPLARPAGSLCRPLHAEPLILQGFELPLRVDHVVARQRQRILPLNQLYLEDHHMLILKRSLGSGEIELPHPAELLAFQFRCLLPVPDKALPP